MIELYIVGEITHFFNNKDLLAYAFYIAMITGIVLFAKDVFSFRWKRKYTLIAFILILLSVPLAIEFILKGIGVLDKRFNTFEYTINATRNNLSHVNWHAVEVAKLINDIADLSNNPHVLVMWTNVKAGLISVL